MYIFNLTINVNAMACYGTSIFYKTNVLWYLIVRGKPRKSSILAYICTVNLTLNPISKLATHLQFVHGIIFIRIKALICTNDMGLLRYEKKIKNKII